MCHGVYEYINLLDRVEDWSSLAAILPGIPILQKLQQESATGIIL
jgi:hypothetical protein